MITSDKNVVSVYDFYGKYEKKSKSFAVNLGLVSLQKYIQ